MALRGEVEPISSRRGSQSRAEGGGGTVTYRPTYRAILAKHNYLVRKTLGNGSYSKVKLAISLSRNKEAVAIKIVDRLVLVGNGFAFGAHPNTYNYTAFRAHFETPPLSSQAVNLTTMWCLC